MKIIEVHDLSYSYDGKNPTLSHLSFDVEAGSYVALLGHNGSGKSTLAKVLCGLLSGFSGEVKLFGIPLTGKNLNSIRSHLGIVFQNPDNQFVGTSVEDDIAFGLENRAIPHESMGPIIQEYASKVGMSDYLKASPENLSGGQKQRVAIAGVLAMKPDLIIYDEATSMLDPKGKEEILALTRQMKKENPSLTIISITHDIEEAAKADEVLVLNGGALLEKGSPSDVFSKADELAKIHLALPFYMSLINALKKEGIDVPSSVKNLEELEAYLCQ